MLKFPHCAFHSLPWYVMICEYLLGNFAPWIPELWTKVLLPEICKNWKFTADRTYSQPFLDDAAVTFHRLCPWSRRSTPGRPWKRSRRSTLGRPWKCSRRSTPGKPWKCSCRSKWTHNIQSMMEVLEQADVRQENVGLEKKSMWNYEIKFGVGGFSNTVWKFQNFLNFTLVSEFFFVNFPTLWRLKLTKISNFKDNPRSFKQWWHRFLLFSKNCAKIL